MNTSGGGHVAWGQSVIRGSRMSTFVNYYLSVLFCFILDASPSMDDKVGKSGKNITKFRAVQEAVNSAMDVLNSFKNRDKCIVCVTLFGGAAWVAKKQAAPSEVRSMNYTLARTKGILKHWGTAIGDGIRLGAKTMEEVRANLKQPVKPEGAFFVLSDGEENMDSDPLGAAEELKSKGHLIFPIAFGKSADRELLRKMASKPEWFGEANDLTSLIKVFDCATQVASRTLGVQ